MLQTCRFKKEQRHRKMEPSSCGASPDSWGLRDCLAELASLGLRFHVNHLFLVIAPNLERATKRNNYFSSMKQKFCSYLRGSTELASALRRGAEPEEMCRASSMVRVLMSKMRTAPDSSATTSLFESDACHRTSRPADDRLNRNSSCWWPTHHTRHVLSSKPTKKEGKKVHCKENTACNFLTADGRKQHRRLAGRGWLLLLLLLLRLRSLVLRRRDCNGVDIVVVSKVRARAQDVHCSRLRPDAWHLNVPEHDLEVGEPRDKSDSVPPLARHKEQRTGAQYR